jgi:hypothetical protein
MAGLGWPPGLAADWPLPPMPSQRSARVTEVGPGASYPATALQAVRVGQATAGGEDVLTDKAGMNGVG